MSWVSVVMMNIDYFSKMVLSIAGGENDVKGNLIMAI
jgi:hypothetical protein